MKILKDKPAATPVDPVFPFVIRPRGAKTATPAKKVEKRENTFSKSRDTREDRGTRQMKTSHNAQTMPPGNGQ
jgi:hypothetical protein